MHRSDECGRIFVYRKDETRFDKDHVQVTNSSGRKTVPVWAWFSAEGGLDFVSTNGWFIKEKYLEIPQMSYYPFVNFIHESWNALVI